MKATKKKKNDNKEDNDENPVTILQYTKKIFTDV